MSQNTLVLPTSGTFDGLTEQGYINNALDTLKTHSSGAAAPSSPTAWMIWADTTNNLVKIYNGSAWVTIGSLVAGVWTPYSNAIAVPFAKIYSPSDQTITAGGNLTLAHGLTVAPDLVTLSLVNTSGDIGFSSGDVVKIAPNVGGSGSNQGIAVWADTTNINIRYGSASSTFQLPNKTTGVFASITDSRWNLRVRAYA